MDYKIFQRNLLFKMGFQEMRKACDIIAGADDEGECLEEGLQLPDLPISPRAINFNATSIASEAMRAMQVAAAAQLMGCGVLEEMARSFLGLANGVYRRMTGNDVPWFHTWNSTVTCSLLEASWTRSTNTGMGGVMVRK